MRIYPPPSGSTAQSASRFILHEGIHAYLGEERTNPATADEYSAKAYADCT
jgi:hypothetical protein